MEYFHLTTPQQNIWNLQKYYADTAIANLCGAIFFPKRRDSVLMQRAVCQFIRSQSGIRLRFCETDMPMQYVSDEVDENIPVLVFQSREEMDQYAETFAREPIGLLDRQMYRFVVFHLEKEKRSGVLVALSHLISDAWTFGLMANQVELAYRRLSGETELSFSEGDYADFIQLEEQYLKSERYGKDKKYWEEKYVIRPEASPVRMRSVSTDAVEAKRITRNLSISLEQNIAAYCRKYPVTQAVLFETALVVYLTHINADIQSVTIGIPVLNRNGAKEKAIAGMFVSTMPLTVDVTKDMEILELAGRITRGHMDLFRHQKYSYADILRSLREKQDFSGNLYDVMISYQNAKTKTEAETKWYSNGNSEVPLVIHIDNRDGNDSHTINVDYQTAVFGDGTEAEWLIERLEYILEQIAEERVKLVGDISIVPPQEYDKVVYEFNDTYVEYPRRKCVHELFMEQAQRTPERVALVFEDKKFTYRQLDEMSNSLAHFIREKGVKPNEAVPVIAKRSWHVIVALLGILKAGGAYMPVDSSYPDDRIESILEDSAAKIALCYQFFGKINASMVNMDCLDFEYNSEAIVNINVEEDSCYIIYTSGSTGKPKGICQTHRCLCNLVCWQNRNISLYKKKILSATSITFDVSIQEAIYSLLSGGCMFLSNEFLKMNPSEYIKYIVENEIEIVFLTPSYFKLAFDTNIIDRLANVHYYFFAGEKFEIEENIFKKLKTNKVILLNQYGPSETHVVTNKRIDNILDITIGSPIANTQLYILDKDSDLLPIGVVGELCIAGNGVGKGYLNCPELTKEKFVPNPFATESNRHGKIMYRTGDLARWRADGEIEYLGRIDTQVKIRGLRIELGEIESVMGSMAGMGLAAVADKRDENGHQYLVGYYTVDREVDERKLRRHLSEKLPKYMVPNYFMRLETMPMTSSGKTDRRNLPIPDFTGLSEEYMAPATDTEKRLALIWQKLLSVEKAGRTDDFFELGGDSLLAISTLSEIERKFHVEVSIKEIMEHSSLEQMALRIDQAKHTEGGLTACHEKKYVLLPQQKAIYAACQKQPDTLMYNMPAKIVLPPDIDKDKLIRGICQVLEHHKILKSYIHVEENEIYGIYDEDARIQFEKYQSGEEERFVRAFDLTKAPLVHIGFTEDALLFDMHHIIADGNSLNIILRDIVELYEGKALCRTELWFSDYAGYFYKLDFREHKAYFKEMLKCEFEPIVLPETKEAGRGGASRIYLLSEGIFQKVKSFAEENGLSETMVFLGAYGILLSKYTVREDILSSVILQNRIHADTKDMTGMFVNTLPVYLPAGGDMREYMEKVKELVLNLLQYQELPFWDIASAVGMEDKTVVNTSFVYQGDGEKKLTLDGKNLIPQTLDTHTAKFDLSMELTPLDEGCRLRMEYDLAKYDGQLVDELAEAYIRILGQLDRQKIADISVLPEREYHRIVEEFNNTYADYPREKCVHELFMEQAQRTPEQVALVFEDKKFTYRQLDEMSNSLAYFLREKGVQCGDRVAVLLKRDERVIMAQLAVLKLGAVFIPIDSRYPQERVEYILSESDAKVLIKNRDNNMTFSAAYDIDEWDTLQTEKLENIYMSADEACYVIFTSGSTGKPKGCILTHRGVANFCRNNNILDKCNQLNEQICASVNTISFDFFIAESLLPLLNGYTIILANEEESVNQKLFSHMVMRNRVNIIQTTPTRHKLYFADQEDLSYTNQFSVIVTSGEALSLELLKCFAENTDATIFNPLGPSECSVWVTGGELCLTGDNISKNDITIGKPIANTQIYILDSNCNPLPIGVAGELCIAGDGVGKGYLNQPELTAERFVPNPFATEVNRHGKIMYHTGDLVRWRRDGEIEYLGRIDTQVKIRGLRIELGEIESVMGGMEEIGLAAAADKRDESGRQYLVGYYTADREIDERELRRHLSRKLPKYMVPNYFMRLETMPMTPSGKTDRKNLPTPDFTAQAMDYRAPKTDRERKLCRLLEGILSVERVGTEDDFFDMGGDSLTAIEYVAKAYDAGIDFALQNVFDYPTVRSLCDYLDGGDVRKVCYEASDFEKYQNLFAENVIKEDFIPDKKPLGNVLLTGATGFLGAHVLDCLMKEETEKIYCLVRSSGTESGEERLRNILQYYFGDQYDREIGGRLIPIEGDIGQEDLMERLSERLLENLPEKITTGIQTVIHTAASVKHYGSYEYFRRINVEGTRHIAEFARAAGAKLIHVSTLSVSGNSMADDFAVYRSEEEKHFYETSFYMGQSLDNVYIHSKFEAERAVYDAMLSGLDAKIIRVGNLTNRLSDFKFQPNYKENAFLTRVKAVLEFGVFPDYLMPLYSEFSPVDKTAEGVIKITQYADKQCVFHLNSNRPIYFKRLLEVIGQLGIPMRIAEASEFLEALRRTMKSEGTEYIFEALQNDMDEQGKLVYDSNIRIENDFTVWFLKKVNFEWNETDLDYISGYVEYFRRLGYLKV